MAYETLGYGFNYDNLEGQQGDPGPKGYDGVDGYDGVNGQPEPVRDILNNPKDFTIESADLDGDCIGRAAILADASIAVNSNDSPGTYYSHIYQEGPTSDVFWWRAVNCGPAKLTNIRLESIDGGYQFACDFGGWTGQEPPVPITTYVIIEYVARSEEADE